MSLSRNTLAAIVLVVPACAPPGPALTAAHRAAIVDSVQTILVAWRDAFNAREFARVATFYSNDPAFRWFENGELKFRSGRELGDTMQVEAPRFRALALTLMEPQVTALAPGVAVATTAFTEKITDSTGEVTGVAGAVSMTVVHGDSGWKFLVGHTSLVLPPVDTSSRRGPRRT